MKHKSLRRVGAVAISLALAAGLTVTSGGSAQAGAPWDMSARWLHKQLTNGVVHNDQFDFDDYGLSVDFGFALIAINGEDGAREIRKALAANIEAYVTGGDFAPNDIYAGATAKALVFAQVSTGQGGDPTDFGGVDLVKQLNRRVSNDNPIVGRIQDKSASDYANVIGQAYAAKGLAVAGSKKADEALKFLLKQQCDKGWFRLNFAKATKRKQSCDSGKASLSVPDTDATALTVLSLLALPKHTKAVTAAINDAVRWLERKQKRNGSFGGGTSTEAPNSNSTGLAASALGGAGSCKAANKAADWVAKLQVYREVGEPTAPEGGAIAYDKAAFAEAKEDGIGVEERDQWRRATAQAAPALLFVVVDGCD